MAVPILFDSDGGVDDAVALWFACTSPEINLLAVTAVAGNTDAVQAAANLMAVLAAAGRPEVPVGLGADGPLGPAPGISRPVGIHGPDGLGGAGGDRADALAAGLGPADELLAQVVADQPGPVTVVATGPLTNLGHRVRADPGWARQVAHLVVMGGSARAGGNATPAAEANVAHDPTAAAEVVAAGWSRPPLLVGLDVTHRATFTPVELALLDERRTPAAAFCAGPVRFYQPQGSTLVPDGTCPCHDFVAMMAAVDDDLVQGPIVPVSVDVAGGPAWGATVADLRQPLFAARGVPSQGDPAGSPCQVGLDVDVGRFRRTARALFGG